MLNLKDGRKIIYAKIYGLGDTRFVWKIPAGLTVRNQKEAIQVKEESHKRMSKYIQDKK